MFEEISNKIKSYEIEDTTIECYDNQSMSEKVILCFPSTTNRPHIFYDIGEELKEDVRIISVSYPNLNSINQYISIIEKLLDRLEIDEFYLLGYEHGGLIAQLLLASLQNRCNGVVLIHATTKTSTINDNIVKSHVKNLKKLIKSHNRFIKWLFRRRYKKGIRKAFKTIAIEDQKAYEDFYIKLFMDTKIKDLANIYKLLLALWDSNMYFDESFNDFNKAVIIIESKEEKNKEIDEKEQLKTIFNTHKAVVLKENKTLSLLKNRKEILRIIREFTA